MSNVMQLKVTGLGAKHSWREIDLSSINYREDMVYFTLAGFDKSADQWTDFVEYGFPSNSRYRILEEMDLSVYWGTGLFGENLSLYEIHSGGWLDGHEDETNLLAVWNDFGAREWLLATTNFTVSVASLAAPTIQVIGPPNA